MLNRGVWTKVCRGVHRGRRDLGSGCNRAEVPRCLKQSERTRVLSKREFAITIGRANQAESFGARTHMRVLISGAGIAGLTAAFWLRRYGFVPTIVERAPSLATGGYKIDVRGTALQVLRRMRIHDAVIAASTDMQGALLVDKDGKVINQMSGNAFGHRAGEDVEIVRGTLCEILMDHISDVEFIFGDSIRSISQSSDRVRVELARNGPREFDLVIGADGLHSNVRRLVFGDETRFVHELILMRVYGAELSAFGSVGNAVLRVGESGCDLEFSRRCKRQSLFWFRRTVHPN